MRDKKYNIIKAGNRSICVQYVSNGARRCLYIISEYIGSHIFQYFPIIFILKFLFTQVLDFTSFMHFYAKAFICKLTHRYIHMHTNT